MQTLRKNWLALLVLLLLALFPFLTAWLTGNPLGSGPPKFWMQLLIQAFILAVYAMSYDLLMGFTGILSFGHAAFFGTGAYVLGILLKHAGWPLGPALLALIAVAIVQGLLMGAIALRVKGVYFAMVTLAFAELFFILAEATDLQRWTGAEEGLQGIPIPTWINPTDYRMRFYYLALIFMLLMYMAARRLVDSPTGHVFVAVRENENRSAMIGYNTRVYRVIVIVLSGVMAALAGGPNALLNGNASPQVLGVDLTIDALLMTIVGGVGTLIGPILGAGVLQLLGHWLSNSFGPRWPLIIGVVYILLVLFLPYGIVGTWRLRRLDLRQGRQRLLALLKGR